MARMKLIRGLENLRQDLRGCVATVGTYDGLHLGHQALLRHLAVRGARLARPTVMVTFEPMPREYLTPASPPPRLTTLRERWRVLQHLPLDYLWVLRFNERLRSMNGDEFAQVLARNLGAAAVVVGHDFKFGRGAEGTAAVLEKAGQRLGFEVDVVPAVQLDDVRVSSSAVRDAVARGDFKQAQRWLGRPYSMVGPVVHGNRLGTKLGFPTANLRPRRLRSPLQGIFAVRVRGAGAGALPGVASYGTRPSVHGVVPILEAHIFDFDADIYGDEIEVEFVAKLRDELYFASLDEMVQQMHRDAAEARQRLNERG